MKKLFNNMFLLLFSITLSLNLYSGLSDEDMELLGYLDNAPARVKINSVHQTNRLLEGVEIKAPEDVRARFSNGISISYRDSFFTKEEVISHAFVIVRGGNNVSVLFAGQSFQEDGFINKSYYSICQKLGLENIKGIRCIYFDWCPELIEGPLIKDSKINLDKDGVSLACMATGAITDALTSLSNLKDIVFLGFGKGCEIISEYLLANHKKINTNVICIFVGSTVNGEIACNYQVYNFYSRGDIYAASSGLKKLFPPAFDRTVRSYDIFSEKASILNLPIKISNSSPSNFDLTKLFLEKFNILFDFVNKFKDKIEFLDTCNVPFAIDFLEVDRDLQEEVRFYLQFDHSELDKNVNEYIDQLALTEDLKKEALLFIKEKFGEEKYAKLSTDQKRKEFGERIEQLKAEKKAKLVVDEELVGLIKCLKDNSRDIKNINDIVTTDYIKNCGSDGLGMLTKNPIFVFALEHLLRPMLS